jgi:hypothetical protein
VIAYPNPANTMVGISLQGFDTSNAVLLNVYDAFGKLILTRSIHSKEHWIDTSDWNAGFYLISFSQNERSINMKIIISK